MDKLVKVILAVLFFLCLLDMPYGYYQLVRFIGLIGFAILAYQAFQEKNQPAIFIYVLLAILFQPFVKIALGRELWNVIDVIVSVFLIGSLFITSKKS